MKRLIPLVLLVAMLGTAYADVAPLGRQPRPPVNMSLESVYQPWLAPFLQPLLRSFAPSQRPQVMVLRPAYGRARQGDIPVPPVCGLSCLMRPVQGLAR